MMWDPIEEGALMRIALACILFGFSVIIPLTEAQARNRAARGAVLGGITGAAIGGGRGALIGGAVGLGVGSVMGSQMDRRRGNYYWYNGRCWIRSPNGEFHPVANRYCR
jgi:hypothetical protein